MLHHLQERKNSVYYSGPTPSVEICINAKSVVFIQSGIKNDGDHKCNSSLLFLLN